jgi:DDE superfamily endonuclease
LDAERRAHPEADVQLWAEDEARLGLIPIVRRVWALRGQRPVALGRRRYQWLYVFGFVRPTTGEVFWLLLPTVSAPVFQMALELFATSLGVGPDKRVLLVVDGAGWHMAKEVRLPQGLRLLFLPAYSPELQPAERLWPLLHEPIANRPVETLMELEEILQERCRWLSDDKTAIRGRTHYHWWPGDIATGP